ncbi:MAG: SDR family oxidoreductase [Candidatus Pararuminococcus gallinarum]|jgi:uncharacterized oxidoreductase
MKLAGHHILITGGSSGIGLALARAFTQAGSKVIICGRQEARLKSAQAAIPGLEIKVCDIAQSSQREDLFAWVTSVFPQLDVLINNAGIQRSIDLSAGTEDLFDGPDELTTNLMAPIHLCGLFIPFFLKKETSYLINVSSDLGITPAAEYPIYCAGKSALHTYSQCLRHQLRHTGIKVTEILPPAVVSGLNPQGRAKNPPRHMMAPDDYAAFVLKELESGCSEVLTPRLRELKQEPWEQLDSIFHRMNPLD